MWPVRSRAANPELSPLPESGVNRIAPAVEARLASRTRGRRLRALRRALILADVCGLGVAFVAAELLFPSNTGGPHSIVLNTELALFVLSLPGWLAVAHLYGLYS